MFIDLIQQIGRNVRGDDYMFRPQINVINLTTNVINILTR